VLFIQNSEVLFSKLDKLFYKAEEIFNQLNATVKHVEPKLLFVNQSEFIQKSLSFSIVELHSKPIYKIQKTFDFYIQPQPSFNKQFDLLLNNLNENHFNGFKNYLFVQTRRKPNVFMTFLKP